MKQGASNQGEGPFIPPVSAFAGPIAELVGHRLLSPPTRPGLLASLARFEVVRVLGGGGMGVVVLARDSERGTDVAIKLIKPELVPDQRMMHRFVKEAGHLQKLKHPNVVPVLEVSDRPEGPYFVMPYFERGSLAHRIRPGQPMEPDAILDIARQVAEGLAFAHRHGIIHRDLKPANILLGADGRTCLADFGLARTMFNDTIVDVEGGQLEGTAPYMSPGIAAGNAEDTRCDIYAFGALLYEMLTGEPPYAGRNTNDVRNQILAGPPKPIQARNPAAAAGLVAVAEGAMARELRDRYADMADVLADLERISAGKATLGPHGISRRAKQLPNSLWIPAGVLLIVAGLLMLWPSRPVNKPVINPPATNLPPPLPPPVVQPPPSVVSLNVWRVAVLAGQPGVRGSADGAASEARFQSPSGVAVDSYGNVCVADTGNNTIRKIARDGAVSTLAGLAGKLGRQDGRGSAARFLAPLGIAVDGAGNVYVAEFASDLIRKITSDGEVSTLAGSAGNPGSADGTGDDAHFRNPWSVAVDSTGDVFIADKSNFTIRQISPTGRVSTFAGFPGIPGGADGPGSYARFRDPLGVAVGLAGDVYVADAGNNTIRRINSFGMVSNLAGMTGRAGAADGIGSSATFSNIQTVAVGELGNIYVLDGDAIRKVTPGGVVTTLPNTLLFDGHGNAIHPTGMAADATGNLYLADGMNNVIWRAMPPSSTPK
ncbi:MAG: protein kinase domain-containing protein [Limisphaerales bacterium]